jgi:hypothetical protein
MPCVPCIIIIKGGGGIADENDASVANAAAHPEVSWTDSELADLKADCDCEVSWAHRRRLAVDAKLAGGNYVRTGVILSD